MSKSELVSLRFVPEKEPTQFRVVDPIGAQLITSIVVENSLIPDDVYSHPDFQAEYSLRTELSSRLRSIFEILNQNNSDVMGALENNILSLEEYTEVLKLLERFFEQDPSNSRLVLYLPFELYIDMNKLEELTLRPEKREHLEKFQTKFFSHWLRALHYRDFKATFDDGDRLEPALGDPRAIHKAGHLIPDLLAKGMLEPVMLERFLNVCEDQVMIASVCQGIFVAHHRNLLSDQDLQRLKQTNVGFLIEHHLQRYQAQLDVDRETTDKSESIAGIEQLEALVEAEMSKIEDFFADNPGYVTRVEPLRIVWERAQHQEIIVARFGSLVCELLSSGSIDLESVSLHCDLSSDHVKRCLIRGVYLLCESVDAGQYFDFFQTQLLDSSAVVRSEAENSLSKLHKLGKITAEQLQSCSIVVSDLSQPLHAPSAELVRDMEADVRNITEKISLHPELSKYVYPTMLLLGSRVKGYANSDSDFDAAIFFTSQAELQDRSRTFALLDRDIPELSQFYPCAEFWVEEGEKRIDFRPAEEDVYHVATDMNINFLFSGVWVSADPNFEVFLKSILKKYLDLSSSESDFQMMREKLLLILEDDVIRSRILHKGYKRKYPLRQKPEEDTDFLLDGTSVFWDSGFRQVATQLFLTRVFLPDLS